MRFLRCCCSSIVPGIPDVKYRVPRTTPRRHLPGFPHEGERPVHWQKRSARCRFLISLSKVSFSIVFLPFLPGVFLLYHVPHTPHKKSFAKQRRNAGPRPCFLRCIDSKRIIGLLYGDSVLCFYRNEGGISMDAKAFGAFLAETRRAKGLTQSALAEQLHVTDKAVSRWERGGSLR